MGLPSNNDNIGNVDEFNSSTKAKGKNMVKKKLYVDIVIGNKTWVTIMLEMGGYDVITNVSTSTDMK